MIANCNPLGKSFKALLSYLETGKDKLHPERVEWSECRNLPGHDLDVAARVMSATSRLSDRVEKPVYHFSVSFALDDEVDREVMRKVADGVLRDLGLHEHQVVLVSHQDTAHRHLHFAVNTVHPERARAWDKKNDWARVRGSLRALEKELGLQQVPDPDRSKAKEKAQEPTFDERHRFYAEVRRYGAWHFRDSNSWGELESRLAQHGWSVQMRGRGMVVTDGRSVLKASNIDPDRSCSRARVEDRFGRYSDYRALRAAAWKTEERTYWNEFKRLSTSISKLYEEPAKARGALLRMAEKSRPDALRTLLDKPERFGRVRTMEPAERTARLNEAAVVASRFIQARADRPRPTMKLLAARIREAERQLVAQASIPGLAQTAAYAKAELNLAYERRTEAKLATQDAFAAIRMTYADPAVVEQAIWRAVKRDGADATARAIEERPEQFGELRAEAPTRSWAIWEKPDTSRARESVPQTAESVRTAAEAIAAAPIREAIDALRARVTGADAALSAARGAASQLAQGSGAHMQLVALAQRAAHQAQQLGMRALGPIAQGPRQILERTGVRQIQQLAAMVKAPHVAVVKGVVELAVNMARGDDGRDGRGRGR